jgi:VCBS repeat-containing protein
MKSPALRMLVLAVLVAGLAGAAVWIFRGGPPQTVRIAGRTVGQDGRPLADVRITLEVAPNDAEEEGAVERAETLSDARGEFAIDYQGHWKRASYRLEARKAGYRELSIGAAETLKNPVVLKLAPGTP